MRKLGEDGVKQGLFTMQQLEDARILRVSGPERRDISNLTEKQIKRRERDRQNQRRLRVRRWGEPGLKAGKVSLPEYLEAIKPLRTGLAPHNDSAPRKAKTRRVKEQETSEDTADAVSDAATSDSAFASSPQALKRPREQSATFIHSVSSSRRSYVASTLQPASSRALERPRRTRQNAKVPKEEPTTTSSEAEHSSEPSAGDFLPPPDAKWWMDSD